MRRLLPLLLAVWCAAACTSPRERLKRRIDRAVAGMDARVGVAVRLPDGGTVVRNDTLLPLLSVFKFPVALAVLHRAAEERIPLDTLLDVGPEWLDAGTYSPLRDSLPPEGGSVALRELLRYSVSLSDNIACDRLLAFAGGPEAVDAYVRRIGIDGIRITASERTMHLATENQRLNVGRPSSLCALFDRFLRGGLLPPDHDALLRRLLEQTSTGPDKLRAGVAEGIVLGHKTGSSDRAPDGRRIADNDAGYLLLPDGRTCTLAVLVTDSREQDADNARAIARIAQAVVEALHE